MFLLRVCEYQIFRFFRVFVTLCNTVGGLREKIVVQGSCVLINCIRMCSSLLHLALLFLLFGSGYGRESHLQMQNVEAFFRAGGEFNALIYYGRMRFSRLLIPQLRVLRRFANDSRAIREGRVLDRVYVAVNTKNATDLAYLSEFLDGTFFVRVEVEDHAVAKGTFGWCSAL